MAKSIPTTSPSITQDLAEPGNPPGLDLQLASAQKRIAELEARLREAADALALKPGKGLHVPFKLCDLQRAGDVLQPSFTFRFGTHPVGSVRQQKLHSLMLGLTENHATLADGQHVDNHTHAMHWLIDQVSFVKGAHDVR